MALTNFAALTTEQKTAWSMEFWKHARRNAFITNFTGTGSNAMIQRITDLRKDKKGARAVLTLVADLLDDGIMGDNWLEGNEEAMQSFDTTIQIDQIRHANRLAGRMADQKSIVNFRNESKDKLGYWAADRIDQMAFLTLSGLPYTYHTNGSLRPVKPAGQNLDDLEFAPDPAGAAPTANRSFYLGANGVTSGTGYDAPDGTLEPLTYKSLVRAKAAAKDSFLKPLRIGKGQEVYHVFVTPQGMADLRLDPDFLANVRNAGVRGSSNELFSGTSSVMVDGMVIHEYHHVYSNELGAAGSRFGATSGNDIGQRVLMCGAQALGFADIGISEWVEDKFDYDNQLGISIAKIIGFLKPQFKGNLAHYNSKEDFGVITIDTGLSVYS